MSPSDGVILSSFAFGCVGFVVVACSVLCALLAELCLYFGQRRRRGQKPATVTAILTPRTPLATNARFIETAAGVHSYSQL
jgi:hypothetical protein